MMQFGNKSVKNKMFKLILSEIGFDLHRSE